MVSAGVYLVQYIFSALYNNPQRLWDVLNAVSGVGAQSSPWRSTSTGCAPMRSSTLTLPWRSGSPTTG